MLRRLLAGAAIAVFASAGFSAEQWEITEMFAGLSGEDGTADWIEVTNTGDATGDTGVLWYDDASLDIGAAGQLPSYLLGPGDSAAFLVALDAGDEVVELQNFVDVWGAGPLVGAVVGGGSLGQSSDTAGLLLGDGSVVTTATYPDGAAGLFATMDFVGGEPPVSSQIGVNGAYESNPFFNDNIGDPPDYMITLIGSPGVIPEPASLVLFVIGAAMITRRR